MRPSSLILCAVALGGCPPEDACTEQAPSVVLGTAEPVFEPLEEGDPVRLVHGPQGGWHVLFAARAEHTTSEVTLRLTVDDRATDVPVSELTYEVNLFPDGECAGLYAGMVAIVDVDELDSDAATPAEALGGRELLVRLEVEDAMGRTAVDEVAVWVD